MSKCINCSSDVDSNGTCTECRTRHEHCASCKLFVTKFSKHKQYCPICGGAVELLDENENMEAIFLNNYPEIITKIKDFIDAHDKPVYEYEIYDLLKDILIDGYRLANVQNRMTLPNLLKYIFRKSRGYSKVRSSYVIFRAKKGNKPDIEASTLRAICKTEVYEKLNMIEYHMVAEVDESIPTGYYRLTLEETQLVLKEHKAELERKALEDLRKNRYFHNL